jgi:tetratricopeptide (TPR) repeat protein
LLSSKPRFSAAWLLPLLVAGVWLAYWPGLDGGFLFDDFANLPVLAQGHPAADWPAFWRFITSGTADPTGRPLSLLSFLPNASDWPDNPAAFLHVNVALHALNAVLLFGLLRALGRAVGDVGPKAAWTALLAASLWALHPLFVSTTLYAVQREAMLPATFSLATLWAYVVARGRYLDSGGTSGLAAMWIAVGLGTALACLSKANGVLLPLLVGVVEAVVYQGRRTGDSHAYDPRFMRFKALCILVPSGVVLAYLLRACLAWNVTPDNRAWTIGQRLMTEPRVLFEYLSLLLVPRSVSTGLFNDNFPVSTDWFHPVSTIPAAAAVIILVVAAWRARRTRPALAVGILFFFAGHLLESGPLPLELYYEHRNYLPSLLLSWPLARAISSLRVRAGVRTAIGLAVVFLVGLTTLQRAQLWGNPQLLAETWITTNPGSARAQAVAANIDISRGRGLIALQRLDRQWRKQPDSLQLAFSYLSTACAIDRVTLRDRQRIGATLRTATESLRFINPWLSRRLEHTGTNTCSGLQLADIDELVRAALENPAVNAPAFRAVEIEPLLALIALRQGRPEDALAHFNLSLAASRSPDVAARQVSMLAEAGHYRQALAHLDYFATLAPRRSVRFGMPMLHAWVLDRQRYWPRELSILRTKLHAEIDAESRATGQSGKP